MKWLTILLIVAFCGYFLCALGVAACVYWLGQVMNTGLLKAFM